MENASQKQLVDYLKGRGLLKSPRIEQALTIINRRDFISSSQFDQAYSDHPVSIGYGQTISQPSTVIFMLEQLKIELGDKVLDVGSGSGWQAAILSHLVGDQGSVIGVEIVPDLIRKSKESLNKYDIDNVKIIHGDGYDGFSLEAPYDKIIVAAASSEIPSSLMHQLKVGGRMILPVGQGSQSLVLLEKVSNDRFQKRTFPGFIFVPLVKT
jgi:protein-L-isoaspartate(D-aspartate) O-methyltransferase